MASALAEHPESAFQHAVHQFGARLFEAAPGLVTWIMLLAPAWIPILFKTPGALLVASAVLVFDMYWLIRAVTVVTGVYSTVWRMRRDMAKDWLAACRANREEGAHDPLQYYHLCIIPTYTEPYHVLERTVQAIVESNYPPELTMVGIITRETDKPGWENVARLKEKFGSRLKGFYHIKDPLEPGIVIGKSAAMNWGGRWMVRVLTEEGYDLDKILITNLDSDYRVHPQYFPWISWHHARTPLRDYVFDHWEGTSPTAQNPVVVLVNQNLSYQAVFRLNAVIEDFESGGFDLTFTADEDSAFTYAKNLADILRLKVFRIGKT